MLLRLDWNRAYVTAVSAPMPDDFSAAVSRFGAATTAKLSSLLVAGEPEDQLRAPLEGLLTDLATLSGFSTGSVTAVGESSLSDLKTRPDYAVVVQKALVGFIEVKAPGKGADPRRFADGHDKSQWQKLQSLPNLIYTDGNQFSLWRNGELVDHVVFLSGDVRDAGASLSAPRDLLHLIEDFLGWQPTPPRTARQLADTSARLCRLLRDEVLEQVENGDPALTSLAEDWRRMLFPEADDTAFADGYAQAVTFGLLMARARNIPLSQGLDHVAAELGQRSSLIGTALKILTDQAARRAALDTSLKTLTRVLDVVDWAKISKKEKDAWLYFYEDFLAVYDNDLRKQTGSYYTPPQVVREMVRLVDDVLRSPTRFGRPLGLASPSVTIADPAMGAGTFLLGILRKIAETVSKDQGPGAVPAAVFGATERVIGFELQFGPFAVAQLRLLAELVDLSSGEGEVPPKELPDLQLFVTDTLGNPFAGKEDWIPTFLKPLAESRERANEIKRREPITVVIGNPPYKEKAKGMGGWVESGGQQEAPLKSWMPPKEWNVGAHAKHLRNLYIYFWRWATWKVFGSGRVTTQAEADAGGAHEGVVCYITVAGFLNGPGFEKMRADLRRTTSEIWVIDASPEGHQPPVSSRVFQGVQQPVCIVIASRTADTVDEVPAKVRFTALPEGDRKQKFATLEALTLDGDEWDDCPSDWRAPFLPKAKGDWADFVPLDNLFLYNGSGVMPGRTWPVAPDAESLRRRWQRLIRERVPSVQAELFHPHLHNGKPGDRHVNKEENTGGLPGHEARSIPVAEDKKDVVTPILYGYRSFDRQYIIPDKRLINRANPTLWESYSHMQVFLTAPTDQPPRGGPALSFTSLIPDLHHYNGRGGRVFPLHRDASASRPNVNEGLLTYLTGEYGEAVTAEDVFAYVASVAAHPHYTERFESDLVQPGLRIPITADAALFREAVELGKPVVWLHTFGTRFVDEDNGRPPGPPRVVGASRPTIPPGRGIPDEADEMRYSAEDHTLYVGDGIIENVTPDVWDYEVSGVHVLTQWFSYRRKDRSRPVIGNRREKSPLNDIQPDHWLPEYTAELINVLNVLTKLVELEPAQADLLSRICDGPTLGVERLRAEGAFDTSKPGSSSATPAGQMSLLD